jgi:hypothetical protein
MSTQLRIAQILSESREQFKNVGRPAPVMCEVAEELMEHGSDLVHFDNIFGKIIRTI